jgi:hypothetical protein
VKNGVGQKIRCEQEEQILCKARLLENPKTSRQRGESKSGMSDTKKGKFGQRTEGLRVEADPHRNHGDGRQKSLNGKMRMSNEQRNSRSTQIWRNQRRGIGQHKNDR